ncbi:MAG TPA: 50S ribosomal protein L21 [Terriglobales bacterium]|jgi:large subunit ribosomal protein L21|nr:50S ribosomal protein L21 [Terriglobales bacterium]
MYAVIRAGGKQYRVAPGDVIRVEKLGGDQKQVEFGDVLAVSGNQGEIGKPQGEARVVGQILDQVLGDKVLVFHYKRKKQYKKLQGHRQQYTAVRITEIAFDGQSFKAAEQATRAAKTPKVVEGGAAAEEAVAPKKKASAKKQASAHASGAGSKTAKGRGTSKSTKSKGGSSPKKK